MRTLEITAYTFDELSETAKEVALYNNRDINTNYDWYQYTYDDAEQFGIKITSFDVYYKNITIKFTLDPLDVANNILNECGPTSDLYSFAEVYRSAYNKLDDTGDDTDENLEELASVFKHALSREYLNILTREFDYLESDEAVTEAIMANMFEFTADGKNLKY
jgi:hypothetical protein